MYLYFFADYKSMYFYFSRILVSVHVFAFKSMYVFVFFQVIISQFSCICILINVCICIFPVISQSTCILVNVLFVFF